MSGIVFLQVAEENRTLVTWTAGVSFDTPTATSFLWAIFLMTSMKTSSKSSSRVRFFSFGFLSHTARFHWRVLIHLFLFLVAAYGNVVELRINTKGVGGKLPNFGFVVFDDSEPVQKILGAKVEGACINISFSNFIYFAVGSVMHLFYILLFPPFSS